MKKSLLLIVLLLMPVVLAQTWTSQESFGCEVCCIENDKFSLTTTITNNGSETLWVGKAKLVDRNDKEFASYTTLDENFRYGLLPGKSINLEYLGKWPKPSIKNSLFYKQCLYLGTLGKWSCEENYKEKTLAPRTSFQCYKDEECPNDKICKISKDCTIGVCTTIPIAEECGRIVRGDWRLYECCSDKDCKEDQYCLNNNCEQVTCKECEYVYSHKCVKFECCDDTGCEKSQACDNNKCVEIKCEYCEYADEHTCKKHECCRDTECEEDEACRDNQCQKVICEKGYVEDHKCLVYQCLDNEECKADAKCRDGFCTKLACEENEIIKNHECEKPRSKLSGYVKGHRYVSYFSKEAYQDNKEIYISIFVILLILIIKTAFMMIKPILKERKRRKSYIVIKLKEKS